MQDLADPDIPPRARRGVPQRYNRLLLHKANIMHSATGYWGNDLKE
ncbi:hypothetical protein ACWEQU_05295 [Streptomyces nodosus]